MKKEEISHCIELTKEIMIRHYQKDDDFAIGYLHRSCIWIGSCAEEFYVGKQTIAEVLKKESKELPDIELTAFDYVCASNDTHECVITGRHTGHTTSTSGEIYSDMQRITFVWKKMKDELLIMHIHVSNPMINLQEGEIFPHKIGKYTKGYFEMLVNRDIKKNGSITIKDQKNRYHIINIHDILYCEAFDMNCIIHLAKNDVFGRITLLDFEQMLNEKNKDMFKRVHKSYLVNRYHTKSLARYELMLEHEIRVPVSQERYNNVRDWLNQC
ncbi:regulator [Erysipelotrichaceae bacterium 66202529]|nr:regulator [Erysipelotrichaceae bacterium 66202529]